MTYSEAIASILNSRQLALTPQELRDIIKSDYPELYGTEAHRNNVERGNYQNLDHALLAQIYTVVRTGDLFNCDKTTKPMKVSLTTDVEGDSPTIEDLESDSGIIYVLGTGTYTREGKEIIKIGFTTQDVQNRISQLFTTGVPFAFTVQREYRTKNFIELENALHRLLVPFRLNRTREFFTEEAIPFIERIVRVHKEIQGEP